MKIVTHVSVMQKITREMHRKGLSIGFVPTMGYLHEGHASLLSRSRKENDISVLSIFVNPKQFGPREDFTRYPRDKKRDYALAKKEKVDIILHPSVEEIYPSRFSTFVETLEISSGLCGAFRPGHFRGVATVVTKLLNISKADVVYLGQKDLQQAVLLKQMVQDLNFPVNVKICPTVREPDGLAMSSRNRYLTVSQRRDAAVLYRALKKARAMIKKGEKNFNTIRALLKTMIYAASAKKIDYIECVSFADLTRLNKIHGTVAVALAVQFGQTRLIDNIIVDA